MLAHGLFQSRRAGRNAFAEANAVGLVLRLRLLVRVGEALVAKTCFVTLVRDIANQIGPTDAVSALDQPRVRDGAERLANVGRVGYVAVGGEQDCADAGCVGGVTDVGFGRLGGAAIVEGVPEFLFVVESFLESGGKGLAGERFGEVWAGLGAGAWDVGVFVGGGHDEGRRGGSGSGFECVGGGRAVGGGGCTARLGRLVGIVWIRGGGDVKGIAAERARAHMFLFVDAWQSEGMAGGESRKWIYFASHHSVHCKALEATSLVMARRGGRSLWRCGQAAMRH